MKKLFYLIFIVSIFLTGNSYADGNDYNICATNADGAILVDEKDVFLCLKNLKKLKSSS